MLDTFAGIGGFSYAATKLVGGYRTTQFIEIDPFCQKILKKHFPFTPIHDDIRTFTAIPGQYDVICGGFPCQSISVAGNRAGITEESRSGIFYELMRVIRMVRPRFVVLENVAAILNNGLDIVLGELSQAGYDAEWSVISASSLGACHRRSRWWRVAYPNSIGCGGRNSEGRSIQKRQPLQNEQQGREKGSEAERCSINTSNPDSERLQGLGKHTPMEGESREKEFAEGSLQEKHRAEMADSDSQRGRSGETDWENAEDAWESSRCPIAGWGDIEPNVGRVANGIPKRVDRLKGLGNAIVPQIAQQIGEAIKAYY